MSESLSNPWISEYLIDIAETYGAQIFNAPLTKKKRRVQLTEFVTYQANSYIWAWVSDKEYRISVRITKDAVDQFNSTHSSPIINSRFSPLFIGDFHPMFAPRPLGANTVGNTPLSHLSLEVGFVKLIGSGTHLFGSPRDLELNEKLRVWISGLRQDGGGGNVLKLKKREEAAQSKKPPPSPKQQPRPVPPPSPKLAANVSEPAKPKAAPRQDFRRAREKRWRMIAQDPWKYANKPTVQEPPTDATPDAGAAATTPKRPPSLQPLSRQGTPTEWSPSNRGSPLPHEADAHAPENDGEQPGQTDVLPTTAQLQADADGQTTTESVVVATSQETSSVQPPTPAQRIKRSPPPRSSSPLRSSPEHVRSLPYPSQHLSHSSPPLPSSSLPPLSSSLPAPVSFRKHIQRKVPPPEILPPRSDASRDGPAQILVPNSDASGVASSQSQQSQPRSQPHASALPSSLAKEFKPQYESTPKVQSPRRTSKMYAEPPSLLSGIEEQGTTSADDEHAAEKGNVDAGNQQTNGLPAPSAPHIEVLQVEQSQEAQEGVDELQLTHSIPTEAEANTQTSTQDKGGCSADADREDNQLSDDDAEIASRLEAIPLRPVSPPAVSAQSQPSPDKPSTNGPPRKPSPQSSEKPVSQSSMHSLFSASFGEEQTQRTQDPPVTTVLALAMEVRPSPIPSHDPDAWKEPSFISRHKGKGKARAVDPEPASPMMKAGKKRRRSAEAESPVPKRLKIVAGEELASGSRKAPSNDRPSVASIDNTEQASESRASEQPKRRLVNLCFDPKEMRSETEVPKPRLDWSEDLSSSLLRSGRIWTLGDKALWDGRVYINQK